MFKFEQKCLAQRGMEDENEKNVVLANVTILMTSQGNRQESKRFKNKY